MTRWAPALTLLALASSAPLVAQTPAVDALVGEWSGRGSLFSAPFEGELVFEPALDGAFLRLRYASRMDQGSGFRPVISAEALYSISDDGTVSGGWFDTRSVRMELRGRWADGVLDVTWTAPDETGRTTYSLLESGELEVVDRVRDETGWREFGRATYRRSR